MLTPLLSVLVLLAAAPVPAPASPDAPLSVLVAPPDAAGVPSHLVDFAQEHVADQLASRNLKVVRMQQISKKLSPARRRQLLKCAQTERRCLQSLGDAAKAEVVLVIELTQIVDDYRVGAKAYTTRDGSLVAEKLISGVREDGMLDALTAALDVVVPQMKRTLRPGSVPEEPVTPPQQQTTQQGTVTPPNTAQGTVTPTNPTKPPEVTQEPHLTPPTVTEKAEPSKGLRRWAWAPAAGGAVFLGVGTVLHFQAKDKHDELLKPPSTGTLTPEQANKLEKDGKRLQTLSQVAIGVGVAGVLAGGLFYLFPGEQKSSVRPTVTLGPGGGMVGVAGTLP